MVFALSCIARPRRAQPRRRRRRSRPHTGEANMPSTVIADMRYDPQDRILSIRFRPSGRRYDYFKVPFEDYDALRHARSKGQYFNRHIRDQYDCALVEEAEEEDS
jgi:hypothetical protein